jgi:ribosome biogenesis GTPase
VHDLQTLGWDPDREQEFRPLAERGFTPGRVAVPHRGAYDVLTAAGETRVRLATGLRKESDAPDLPVVGDWVALGEQTIEAVLTRRTTFARRAPQASEARPARAQVVAANVDVVFVTFPLGGELDPLLLERYVALALESGARPVVLLTKADLEPRHAAVVAGLAEVGGELPVHAISPRSGLGLEDVRAYLEPGVTGALLGPSGAGKSTLVNELVGAERLETGEVRADGTGRHTTTRRELIVLPGGGLVIDNPGMREVHLWQAQEGLSEAFADIDELAASCRFADCRHESEPDCAVREAVEEGRLDAPRWERFRALRAELEELEQRLVLEERARSRSGRPRP